MKRPMGRWVLTSLSRDMLDLVLFCLNPDELLPLMRVSKDFGFLRASQCSVWLSQCKRLWANRLPLDEQQLSLEFDAASAVTLLFRSLHPVPTQLNKYLMPTGARTIWTVSEHDAEDEADSHELLSVQRCVRFNGGQTGQNRCVRANRPFPSPTQAGLLPFTTLSVGPASKGVAAAVAGRGDSKRSGGGGGESKRRSSSSGAASVEGLLSTAQQRRVVARLSTIAYFEITIEGSPKPAADYIDIPMRGGACVAIGLARAEFPLLGRMPGWTSNSWGLHSDDGNKFHASGAGQAFTKPFGPGDVVGCGIDCFQRTIFFTRNGQFLGVAFSNVPSVPLFPVIGIDSPSDVVVNFGQSPFAFDVAAFENAFWQDRGVPDFCQRLLGHTISRAASASASAAAKAKKQERKEQSARERMWASMSIFGTFSRASSDSGGDGEAGAPAATAGAGAGVGAGDATSKPAAVQRVPAVAASGASGRFRRLLAECEVEMRPILLPPRSDKSSSGSSSASSEQHDGRRLAVAEALQAMETSARDDMARLGLEWPSRDDEEAEADPDEDDPTAEEHELLVASLMAAPSHSAAASASAAQGEHKGEHAGAPLLSSGGGGADSSSSMRSLSLGSAAVVAASPRWARASALASRALDLLFPELARFRRQERVRKLRSALTAAASAAASASHVTAPGGGAGAGGGGGAGLGGPPPGLGAAGAQQQNGELDAAQVAEAVARLASLRRVRASMVRRLLWLVTFIYIVWRVVKAWAHS